MSAVDLTLQCKHADLSPVEIDTQGQAIVGDDFTIRCYVNWTTDLPPRSVSWYNNSASIRPTSRVTKYFDKETGIATLTIRKLTRYDLCTIECRFEKELLKGQFHYTNASFKIMPTGNFIVSSISRVWTLLLIKCFHRTTRPAKATCPRYSTTVLRCPFVVDFPHLHW